MFISKRKLAELEEKIAALEAEQLYTRGWGQDKTLKEAHTEALIRIDALEDALSFGFDEDGVIGSYVKKSDLVILYGSKVEKPLDFKRMILSIIEHLGVRYQGEKCEKAKFIKVKK